MEEKPVRKTDRVAVGGLCMGILGLITSFPFGFVLMIGLQGLDFDWIQNLFTWWFFGSGAFFLNLISPVFGLVALIVGIDSITGTKEKKGFVISAIFFVSLTILGAILFYILLSTGWGT